MSDQTEDHVEKEESSADSVLAHSSTTTAPRAETHEPIMRVLAWTVKKRDIVLKQVDDAATFGSTKR